MKLGDATSGALVAAFGAAVAWQASGFPRMPGHVYGAGLFPLVVGIGLVLCGLILIGRGLATAGGLRGISIAEWRASGRRALGAALVVAVPLAFIWLLEPVGFLLLALVSMFVLFLLVGVAPLRALAVSAAASLVGYWLFAKLLRVPLPRGLTAFLGF
jgi:putative tricarboxylic transport membrane protein